MPTRSMMRCSKRAVDPKLFVELTWCAEAYCRVGKKRSRPRFGLAISAGFTSVVASAFAPPASHFPTADLLTTAKGR